MENKRSSFSSTFGFIMSAIGSAVGLGNIWGFPYKMGKSGGFAFLIVYLALGFTVGLAIMVSELSIGRKTKTGVIGAYKKVSKKFKWVGWLGALSPFIIMSFYTVLGGYCLQYLTLNLANLSFDFNNMFNQTAGGAESFASMLGNPWGCAIFTLIYIALNILIVKGGISNGIEKFNKIGMPALFCMLIVIICRSVTLPNAIEGIKYMFVPGYAVSAGFTDTTPSFTSILATAGGQMFFSLSLAMGAMVTYGSYLDRKENLIKNSCMIAIADTIVAIMAGLAVIPAAVANGINSGTPLNEIVLGGPKLLFVTLQDVFSGMGTFGALFGIVFYSLVIIAAISSSISLLEVISSYFIDKQTEKGKPANRTKIILWIALAVSVEAVLVAVDGLGSSGLWIPFKRFFADSLPMFTQSWLDFMDFWAEGLMMPIGAMVTSIMIGWELSPSLVLNEMGAENKFYKNFFSFSVKFLCPVAMAMVFAGQLIDFLSCESNSAYIQPLCYGISALTMIVFFLIAVTKNRNKLK